MDLGTVSNENIDQVQSADIIPQFQCPVTHGRSQTGASMTCDFRSMGKTPGLENGPPWGPIVGPNGPGPLTS